MLINRLLLVVCFAIIVLVVAGAAYAVGSQSAVSQDDAQAAMATAREQALGSTEAASLTKARSAARAVGLRLGSREGTRVGSKNGKRDGAREKARRAEQAAQEQAAKEAAAVPIWCDTDGYCLQKSPGWGGAPCPPGTFENAGHAVCVPLSMIKP